MNNFYMGHLSLFYIHLSKTEALHIPVFLKHLTGDTPSSSSAYLSAEAIALEA